MNCPTTDTLEQLALGFLENEGAVRAHATGCAECAKQLEVLKGEHAALTAAAKGVRLPRIAEPKARPVVARLWRPIAIAAGGLITILLALMVTSKGSSPSPSPVSVQKEMAGYKGGAAEERMRAEYDMVVDGSRVHLAREVEHAESAHRYAAEEELARAYAGRSKPKADSAVRQPASKVEPSVVAMRPPPPVASPDPPPAPAETPKREPKPAPPRPDNTFNNPGLNPSVDPTKDPLSTFALDVDTASYTIVRRYLKDGMLPPADAVRLEEFVNYFRYADPRPPKGAFQVLLEAAPSPFDPSLHLLRIAVQAREISDKDRKDCILTFVIDVSGSMAMENRLALVKRSLRALVERLRPTDKVGIVVYGTSGRKLLDPTPASRRAEILGIVDELRTEGATNLEDGVNIGYDLAARHFNEKATNRVIICTDGVANNGVINPELLVKNVADKAAKGIWLSVLGFGMGNLNDALMEKLADKGKGNYAYIDEFKEAKKIFTEKLTGMLEVVAAGAKVQVEFDPRTVSEFRQLGYENRRLAHADFRNDKVDAGEVGANHHVTALYEIRLKPGAEGRLATVRLRYQEPDTKEVVESQESLGRGQVLGSVNAASPSYRLAATVAQFAEILRDGPRAKTATLEKVLEEASRASADLERPEDAVEFMDLVKRAAELKK